MNITLPWKPDEACPCGRSKLPLGRCCLGPDGIPRVRVPSLVPRGEPTGYANPNCYLNSTQNCSEKITKEHYVSRSVLTQLGTTLKLTGLPWAKPGGEAQYGISSMTSRILCDRHNSALSPLDDLAAAAFRVIRTSSEELNFRSISRRRRWFLVSGEALELWAFKTLCGLFYASVAAKEGRSLNTRYSLDLGLFEVAARSRRLPHGSGLYLTRHTGQRRMLSFGPLCVDAAKRVAGLNLNLGALQFDVVLDAEGLNHAHLRQNYFYRPWLINVLSQQRTHTIVLTWPGSPTGIEMANVRIIPQQPKERRRHAPRAP